jgi:preprotein translocase subunit SecD
VLYAFGSNFGATTIVGFATTLFLGVAVSMFTAVVVTRTLLNLLVPTGIINHPALFGLPADAVPAASTNLARRNSAV